MRAQGYDAIVVGARCAGSPTAMLLARKGYRVLLVDRSRFPSDTVSTHLIHPRGVQALDRWGLLERLVGTGCPPITDYVFDLGALTIVGSPQATTSATVAYCPRRTVLDKLLVDAADAAGVEIREEFHADEPVVDGGRVTGIRGHARGGRSVVERTRVLIGADGAHSRIAEAVGADSYQEKPMLAVAYYSYWSGIPLDRATWAVRPRRGAGAFPTNDGLTMLLAAWPSAEQDAVKHDLEGSYLDALHAVYGDWVDQGRQEERVIGMGVANHLRAPYGPGWALVGDAAYLKDPITAHGISDAFEEAELLTTALDDVFSERRSYADAMADYHAQRDARVLPGYEFTTRLGNLEQPPPPELLELLGAIAGNRAAMDDFVSMFAGSLPPQQFFDPGHISHLLGAPSR